MHTEESKQEFIDYIKSEVTDATNDELDEMLQDADWAQWMSDAVRTIITAELERRDPNKPEQLELFN